MSTVRVTERYTEKERVFTSVTNVFQEKKFLHIISGSARLSISVKEIKEYEEVILP